MTLVYTRNIKPERRTVNQPRPIARGTRQDVTPSSEPYETIGEAWFWQLWCEQLARNLSVAAGLAIAYRMGRAHIDFERARDKRVMP